jgi:hypothetical protein
MCADLLIKMSEPIIRVKSTWLKQDDSGKYSLDANLHFYSSALPCGDASIIPMKESSEPPCKKLKSGILDDFSTNTYNDIFRTGAKPVNLTGDEVDPKLPGAEYHKVGIGRTKGGRGPESWSMSCSDKLVKWAHAGLQGGMLSNVFLGPITPKTFVFGPCKSDHGSVFRALSRIGNENVEFNFVENPEFKFSPKNVFKSRVNEKVKVVPCSSAIIWSIYSGGSEVNIFNYNICLFLHKHLYRLYFRF